MTTFNRVIYFHDMVDKKEEQKDLRQQVLYPCKRCDIFFENAVECRDLPQCLDEEFEVLFFDWGGMSLGNSMLDHFCNEILKRAEDRPNKFFVMVSEMTEEAMKDAINEFGKDRPFNLFLTVDDFGDWIKKYDSVRCY